MAQEIRQDIRLSQQLVMSPQLQMAIKLLQLSRMELVEVVREELETNPVLEEDAGGDESEGAPYKKEEREIDWEAYLESCYERPVSRRFTEETEEFSPEMNLAQKQGLSDHLLWQLHLSPFTQEEVSVGEFIIGNIDEDGYLRMGEYNDDDRAYAKSVAQEIAQETGASEEIVETTIKKIQQFDPIGVASRTLKECLLTQAEFLGLKDPIIAEIITNHLHHLENKNYRAIAVAIKISVEEVIEAVKLITELSPRPGSSYGQLEANVIIPDVYIEKRDDEYTVLLNEKGLPLLKISPYYKALLGKNGSGDQTKTYVQEKLRAALWLIKSIHQRQQTIYKVAQSIVKFQREFFDYGVCNLKPLVLRTVAEDIGMHESTVSRVTSNKYAHTPHGIFELKYFFSSGLSKSEYSDIASTSIMEKMRGIYTAEDARKPLSDQQIVAMLKGSGIDIARRTVTKYREALGILSASKRKRFF